METPVAPWEPITFGGAAAFSRASLGRLLLVQFIVALLVAASVLCFLISAWFPVIHEAIARLPEKGAIRRGQLDWAGPSPAWLAEGTFLSIIVDPAGGARTGQSADVQVEFERDSFKVCSLFGCLEIPYPQHWAVALNRTEAEPWWGAWRPFLLVGIAVGVVLGLMAIWLALAAFLSLPLRLIAFYSDRAATWPACWRMAGAVQLPGALLMSGAIFLYGFNRLNLVGFLFAWVLHLVSAWLYVGIIPARLPRLAGARPKRANPFGTGQRSQKRFGD